MNQSFAQKSEATGVSSANPPVTITCLQSVGSQFVITLLGQMVDQVPSEFIVTTNHLTPATRTLFHEDPEVGFQPTVHRTITFPGEASHFVRLSPGYDEIWLSASLPQQYHFKKNSAQKFRLISRGISHKSFD